MSRLRRSILLALGSGGATERTLILAPDVDTYLYRGNAPDTNFATDTYLYVFATSLACNTLIKPDFSSIVDGSGITSVVLTLTAAVQIAATATINIYRILAGSGAWTETGCTWNYLLATSVRWPGDVGGDGGADAGCNVAGTDYSATLMGSFVVTLNDPVGTKYNVTLNLAEAKLMIANNYGLIIKTTSGELHRFASSDHATAAYRPGVTVKGFFL